MKRVASYSAFRPLFRRVSSFSCLIFSPRFHRRSASILLLLIPPLDELTLWQFIANSMKAVCWEIHNYKYITARKINALIINGIKSSEKTAAATNNISRARNEVHRREVTEACTMYMHLDELHIKSSRYLALAIQWNLALYRYSLGVSSILSFCAQFDLCAGKFEWQPGISGY